MCGCAVIYSLRVAKMDNLSALSLVTTWWLQWIRLHCFRAFVASTVDMDVSVVQNQNIKVDAGPEGFENIRAPSEVEV